jgi:hypothetical protein
MMGTLEVIQGVSGVATAIAVVFAALDLRATKEQARRRPAFATAWRELSSRAPESFDELRD